MTDLALKIIPILISLGALAVSLSVYRWSHKDRARIMRSEANQLVGELRAAWRDFEIAGEEHIRLSKEFLRGQKELHAKQQLGPVEEPKTNIAEVINEGVAKLRSLEQQLNLDPAGHLKSNDPVELEETINLVREGVITARNNLAGIEANNKKMRGNIAQLEKLNE